MTGLGVVAFDEPEEDERLPIHGSIMNSERAALVEQAMSELGFDRIEAEFFVALGRGEIHGDIEQSAMTPEERRRIGLDIVAARRASRMRDELK